MNVIRCAAILTLAVFGCVGCSSTSGGDGRDIDRSQGIAQECAVGVGYKPAHDCCGYVVNTEGRWKAPMTDEGACNELTAGRGYCSDGYCSLECQLDEIIVELQPRNTDRLIGCVQCARP